jgi:Tfp pilus assembly protein PilN
MSSKHNTSGASFLPTEYVRNKGQARASMFAILLFVLVLAGVIGAFAVNHQRWSRVRDEQKVVAAAFKEEAAKIEQLKELEKRRIELTDKAEIVTALRDRVPRSVLMGELVRGVETGLTLTEITLEGDRVKPPAPNPKAGKGKVKSIGVSNVGKDKDGEDEKPKVLPPRFTFSLQVQGVAENNDLVADYLASLKASPLLRGVELQYINTTLIDSVEYRKFSITMNLPETADARLVEGTQTIPIEGLDIARVEIIDE